MKLDAGLQNMGKSFQASLDQLYGMLDFIRHEAKEAGFDQSSIFKIELACEEALVNIIRYGYPEFGGDIEIFCSRPANKGLRVEIKDRGVPFDPLAVSKEAEDTPSPKKGYGVFFILKLMDEVSYKREDNRNVLSLTKFLT